jgi:hypothetical protein
VGVSEEDATRKLMPYRQLADEYAFVCRESERVAAELGVSIDPLTTRWPSRIDLTKRNNVMSKYGSLRLPPEQVGITIEDFFDGNARHDSIAANLWVRHPGIETIRQTLEAVRARPGVLDVRISVHQWPDRWERGDDGIWIAAESVFVWVRDVPFEDLSAWLAPLRGDWVSPVPADMPVPVNVSPMEPGVMIYMVGWD